jgi:hypothetical protein
MDNPTINIHSRERMAWGFLLTGFTVLVLILIAIPITINAYIQRATESLDIRVEANQGAVTLNDDQGQRAVLPGDAPGYFETGTSLRTGFPGNALLFITLPDRDEALARLQVGANTTLLVDQAETPRFGASDGGNILGGRLRTGQLQVTLLAEEERPLHFTISTPHGQVQLQAPGKYILEATTDRTQIIAQEGHAIVTAGAETVDLLTEQRAQLTADQPILGPFIPQDNLIPNGDFSQTILGAGVAWQHDAWDIELEDQPTGQIRHIHLDTQSWLRLTREGSGHADISFYQTLDQPVNEASLWLQLKFRIISHSLEVCGFQGSECPLFVQLHYEDEDGNPHDWMQGFYVVGGMGDTAPYACFSCGILHTNHKQVVPGEVIVFEIEMAEIGRLGPQPHLIKNISLVASGHSFDVEIIEVALFETRVGNQ